MSDRLCQPVSECQYFFFFVRIFGPVMFYVPDMLSAFLAFARAWHVLYFTLWQNRNWIYDLKGILRVILFGDPLHSSLKAEHTVRQ